MDKDLSRLCRGYKYLKDNKSYSDASLELVAKTRCEIYEAKTNLPKEEIFDELNALLDYLESAIFSSFYAYKNPNKIINFIKLSYVNIEKFFDEEGCIEVLKVIRKKLDEIFKGLKPHPRENSNKFATVKRALKFVDRKLEGLSNSNLPVEESEEMAD